MRLRGNRIRPAGREVQVTFEGRPLAAYEGETVAACLVGNGVTAFRRTGTGDARGPFCGMGVCFECLVDVDGCGNQRACMTVVADGMTVAMQDHRSPPGAAVDLPRCAEHIAEPEVLVVGGGAAGLTAATAAARCGAAVTLADERPALGGQFFKQLSKAHDFVSDHAMDGQFRDGRQLIRATEAAGVTVLSGAQIWGAFPPREICVLDAERRSRVLRPKQLILATGAYERGLPLPGWTLPGFMTTGAAQTLARAYRVAPGKRLLIAGNGPLNFQVAAELAAATVDVATLVEVAPAPGLGLSRAILGGFRHSADLMMKGLTYRRTLKRRGIPILHGHVLVEVRGEGRVEEAVVAPLSAAGRPDRRRTRSFAVDAVCAGYGFMPANELARALGCRHRYDADRGHLVVAADDDGLTSEPSIYVAGDAGGMVGARAAQEQGFLAGVAAARALGHDPPPDIGREASRRRRRLARHRRFQTALRTLFAAPRLHGELARDDTLLCRCEGVTRKRLQAAMDAGTEFIGSLKRQTRTGMGRCQGRYCGPVIAALIAERTGTPLDEFSLFAPRPPVKPVPIGAIARPPTMDTTGGPPPRRDDIASTPPFGESA